MANTLVPVLLLMTILFSAFESAGARRTLRHRYASKASHSKEGHPQIMTHDDESRRVKAR